MPVLPLRAVLAATTPVLAATGFLAPSIAVADAQAATGPVLSCSASTCTVTPSAQASRSPSQLG
jgi:hypothetical protein